MPGSLLADARVGADVGNSIERIDGAGIHLACVCHDGDDVRAGSAILMQRLSECRNVHLPGIIGRNDAHGLPSETQQACRLENRQMNTVGRVDGRRSRQSGHTVCAEIKVSR